MGSLRTNLKPHLLYTLFTYNQPSSLLPKRLIFPHLLQHTTLFQRTLSASPQLDVTQTEQEKIQSDSIHQKEKKPLFVMFKETVRLIQKHENEYPDEELEAQVSTCSKKVKEMIELRNKLWNLEKEVRSMKGTLKVQDNKMKKKKERGESQKREKTKNEEGVEKVESPQKSLSSLFTPQPKQIHVTTEKVDVLKEKPEKKEVKVMKGLSAEMGLLAGRLYEKGYLRSANFFFSKKEFDVSLFSTYYSQSFLRSAAEKFGDDHQEIAKCLSGDELKRVALFGCPSTVRRTAFAAKRLRSYFSIQEAIVCRPCKLKNSCTVMNHTVGRKADKLNLADVMRVFTWYALELVPPELTIPDEIQASVSKLLKEVVSLSQ